VRSSSGTAATLRDPARSGAEARGATWPAFPTGDSTCHRPTLVAAALAVKVNDATVVTADVQATNGVIHVIDTVLLPPDHR
jgi:hypothetical protein